MSKRSRAYLTLTLVSLIWGVASPVIKYTLDYLPPFTFLFWRFLVTSLVFLPIFLIYIKKHPIKLADLPRLSFLGFLGTPLTLALIFVGYQRTTAMDGVLISATAPIFIALGGAIFLKEKITKMEKVGLGLAIFGSLVTIAQPLFEGGFLKGAITGNILVFGSVLSWTAFTLLSKEDFHRHHPFVITAFCFFIGLLVITPFAYLEKGQQVFNFSFLIFNFNALLGVAYMSLFSSVIAYTLYEYGLSLIEASETTVFAYLQPIFAAPVSLIWLKEPITPLFILGAAIIAAGVLLSEWRPQKRMTVPDLDQ
jgi:drug/metabolite transporter (DMT)-like permease